MTRVIIIHEKHDDYMYDATTDEQWAVASLLIIKSRLDYYIVKPQNPMDNIHESWSEIKAEDVEWANKTVPEDLDPEMAKTLHLKIAKAKVKISRRMTDYTESMEDYQEAKRLVEERDTSMVTVGRGRYERQEPKAWQLLQARRDYEYEGVEIQTLRDPVKEFADAIA